MTREDFLVAYNIGHRDGKVNAYCPNDYDDIFDIKQQPNEDCISRKAVLEGLKSIAKAKSKSDAQKSLMGRVMFFTEHLPSVTPQSSEHTEERTETHECDCISRDARGKRMNEFTKIRDRILARIETYIADIEFAEEQELTEDEKTIFESVKEIINEEFEGSVPLPRFIIHEDGKMKQVEAADERIKLTDEEMKKFLKFVNDYKGIPAEDKQRICEDAIRTTDAIIRLSHSCGVSYCVAKDMVMEIMKTLKKPPHPTTEHIIKTTIKEYLDKDCDDVTELLLALSKDLCERIRKERINGL